MDEIAIKVNNLSKAYKLYDKPIDRLKESINPLKKIYHKDFFALKDLSFEVKKGETIGIIGKNGCGKSTLLKIITGVLNPSGGNVVVNGNISALLELGAGFNPDFTGLENIYLNCTIMGYTREEANQKVPSIIEFADIGDFINQPVKLYSSGMFARLAFAVAINVNPQILIVDETLSVGDFMFQHKCFTKFKELQENGTTILFVSHTMQQIINYCNRAILIHEGNIVEDSYEVERVVFKYEQLVRNASITKEASASYTVPEDFTITINRDVNEHRFGTHEAIIREVYLTDSAGDFRDAELLKSGGKVFLKLVILSKIKVESIVIGVSIKDVDGKVIWGDNFVESGTQTGLNIGKNIVTFEFQLNIVPGEYLVYTGLADISTAKRIELDQRWPVKKISVISTRNMAEGTVFAPSKVFVQQ